MKSPFFLPSQFENRILEVHKEQGLHWIEGLPKLITELEDRWDFRFMAPVKNLSNGFVAEVEYKNIIAILKINIDPDVIAKETLCLRAFAHAAPRIFANSPTEGVFLMEKIEPGHSLKSLGLKNDDEATRIVCNMIRLLQSVPIAPMDLPHLSEINSISLLRGHFDKDLIEKAQSLFFELTTKSPSDVVLHGDLHHGNILSCGDTWKAIDPHGYSGDPVFETSAFIYNPLDVLAQTTNLEKRLKRRLEILSEELPFDSDRTKAWAFCKVMMSIAWTFEDTGQVPSFETKVAGILSSLV